MPEFEGSADGMEPIWASLLGRKYTPDVPTKGYYVFNDEGLVVGSSRIGGIVRTRPTREAAEDHFGDTLVGVQFRMFNNNRPYRPQYEVVRGVRVPMLVNGGQG